MKNRFDLDLLLHAFILVGAVIGWFALTSLSHSFWIQVLLGWIGFAGVAAYFYWLRRYKLRRPNEPTPK